MKNPIPACTKCNTNKFVVRDRSMEKVGTVAGGTLGAGTALARLCSGTGAGAAIGSCIPILGTAAGAGIGALTGTLLGFLAGSATGNAVGERIDAKIRMKYRCTNCGSKIQG